MAPTTLKNNVSFNGIITKLFLGSLIVPIGLILPSLELNVTSALMGSLDTSQMHRTMIPVALLMVLLVGLKKLNTLVIPTSSIDIAIYFIFLLLTTSHVLNLHRGSSTLLYFDHMVFLLFYLIGYNIILDESFKKTVLIASIISIAIYLTLIILSPGEIYSKVYATGTLISEYRNLVPIIIYTVGYLFLFQGGFEGDRLNKFVALSIFIFILLSWSRTGVVFVLLLFIIPVIIGRRSVGFGLFFMIFMLVVVLFHKSIINFLSDYVDSFLILRRFLSSGEEGDQNRITLLLDGWELLLNNPSTGMGFVSEMKARGVDGSAIARTFSPHNQFVDFGIKTGFLGFISLILMNMCLSYVFLQSRIEFVSKFGIVWLAVLAACFTQNLLFNYSGYFLWTIAGVCIRQIALAKQQNRSVACI